MTSPLEESRAEPGVNESSKDVHLVCYTLTHSQWSHLLTAGIWCLKVKVLINCSQPGANTVPDSTGYRMCRSKHPANVYNSNNVN